MNEQVEIWKNVVGYEDIYEVSSFGRVRRISIAPGRRPGGLLRPAKTSGGHRDIGLYKCGRGKRFGVHVLVLTAFRGPSPPGLECRHLDGCPWNNHLGNLAWGTRSENMADRLKHGVANVGDRHWKHKLSPDSVRMIRSMVAGGMMQKDVASYFGVNFSTICDVIRGRTWSWLT